MQIFWLLVNLIKNHKTQAFFLFSQNVSKSTVVALTSWANAEPANELSNMWTGVVESCRLMDTKVNYPNTSRMRKMQRHCIVENPSMQNIKGERAYDCLNRKINII